jgi:uncharacterized protein YjbI with pentapeptide repeats/GTPase SAR1 family protein
MDNQTGLSQHEKRRAGKLLGRIKTVTVFFENIIDAFKETSLADAIKKSLPLVEDVGEALGDVVPPVQFVSKLFENITKVDDPLELGHLALTISYEHAVEQAINNSIQPIIGDRGQAILEAKAQLAALEPCDDVDISTFSLNDPLRHEFIRRADLYLSAAIRPLGYSQEQINKIKDKVHDRFSETLRLLLSDRGTKERFEPFTQYLHFDPKSQLAIKALSEHAKYQRWLFEEAPVLGKAPFALKNIYVEPECGKLTWGEIRGGDRMPGSQRDSEKQKIDPFSEAWGGRHSLLQSVMELIADPKSKEVIVIQGIAGAGKSSFTLRLCQELLEKGLRPIRIRLRDLRFDQHISEALPEAVKLSDGTHGVDYPVTNPEDLFLSGNIFRQDTMLKGTRICRYVLILDGWDEITLGSGQGFKERVEKMLEQVRSEYLSRDLPVRVILTGRPSREVEESKFLREKTTVLTIRPLNPQALRQFVENLSQAVKSGPVRQRDIEKWAVPELPRFDSVFKKYEDEFNITLAEINQSQVNTERSRRHSSSVGIMGLPLLALLATRLIAGWEGNPEELVNNTTTLYRSLIELTCQKAGKAEFDTSDTEGQLRVVGPKLRRLLQQTAAAMTAYGKDVIPYGELELRLEDFEKSLEENVRDATQEHVLSSLVISFYFKGGNRNYGCEFAHKSFREYLFAEGILETLKEYGRKPLAALPLRAPYWRDFDDNDLKDPRHKFSRDLSKLLAPQWLTPEVVAHLEDLITWEIAKTRGHLDKPRDGHVTDEANLLDIVEWKRVRDVLADLWDWWGEGVHLRPQPRLEGPRKQLNYDKSYADTLIQYCLPLDIEQGKIVSGPPRSTTVDSHLGDGIFRLCALVHYHIAISEGWMGSMETEKYNYAPNDALRRYQASVKQVKTRYVLFAPSGENANYFLQYISRINSGGWRQNGTFPIGVNLSGIFLKGVQMSGVAFDQTIIDRAILSAANLHRASFNEASLIESTLTGVNFIGAKFIAARLDRTKLIGAGLIYANLNGATLSGANLLDANLSDAKLIRSDLKGANLSGAKLNRAMLTRASLVEANLTDANLEESHLVWAKLGRAILHGIRVDRAIVNRVNAEYLKTHNVDISNIVIFEGAENTQLADAIQN